MDFLRRLTLSKPERREELLSVYLDGELAHEERARLELLLAADPELRAELEALRRTVTLVRSLPQVVVPRNFILPRPVAARPRPRPRRSWAAPALSFATAGAGVLLMLVLVGDLLLIRGERPALAPAAAPSAEPQELAALVEEPTERAVEAPPAPLTLAAEAPEEDKHAVPTAMPSPDARAEGPVEEPRAPLPLPTPPPPGPTGEEPAAEVEAAQAILPATATAEPSLSALPTPTAVPLAVGPPEEEPAPHEIGRSLLRPVEVGLGLVVLGLAVATAIAWYRTLRRR